MEKTKVLYISPFAPYDTVGHAGGKSHNFYLKALQKTNLFDVRLISFAFPDEVPKLDLKKYGIPSIIKERPHTLAGKLGRHLINLPRLVNPFDEFGGVGHEYYRIHILKMARRVKESGFSPEVVICEWTQAAFVIPELRGIFPTARYAVIEVDVAFLGIQRKLEYYHHNLFMQIRYRTIRRSELKMLRSCDYVFTNNQKDEALLLENNIPREMVSVLPVWFERLEKRNAERKRKIVFYGDMRRKENYLSIIWFVKHVWPLLNDVDVELDIAGNKPVKKVRDLASDRIHVLGFVDDIAKEFAEVSMLVAPLRLGAGIKVKVLEAMGCGLPVLTNHIGIEGIPAINGESYIHCETAEEYQKAIIRLLDHPEEARRIGVNAEKFIDEFYNMEQAVKMFADKILELAKRNGD